MPACPECGRENPDDARFCNACGATLAAEAPAGEQRKVVTVLFCDVVGSTALGESTDPEALRARMQRYFEDLRAIVERHGGTVEKFVGDAVMAVFGIPLAHEDDALRAVRAASEMHDAVSAHGLEARIGVQSGEVVVGGDAGTLVTGDTVNVAARLEQAAPPGEVLIGAETRLLVRDAVRVEAVEPLALKGKAEPVAAFRLVEVLTDAAPLARHLETPLVGRERERQRLWGDFEDAVAGRTCRLFTVLGPAGIGKSRLVADFLERASAEADVLRGRCLPYGEGITYWPLVEMLVAVDVEPERVVRASPEETRVAFRRLLEARARERAQVVVVDDLQWAEPVFLDLVEHVADFSREAAILLLCIARPELHELRPHWGGGKLNATSILLEPLGEAECAALIEELSGDDGLAQAVQERIAAASGGNPLYVEEMVAMVREGGADQAAVVPPTIHALLQARLDLLAVDERRVLEHAAVEGQVFHRGSLAVLSSEATNAELDSHLSALVRKELIRPEESLLPGEEAFRFRHLLIRDAAYAAVPKRLRAELHARFADWLEGSSSAAAFELDEILGYHLEQAHLLRAELGHAGEVERELAGRAAEKLLAAGQAALGRADLPAARRLLERGTGLLPADDPARLAALPDLGVALLRSGELERAEHVLNDAAGRASAAGDQRTEVRARLELAWVRSSLYPDVLLSDRLEDAIRLAGELEEVGDLSILARAHTEIGMCRFMIGHAAEGKADLERAVELARRAGDGIVERLALGAILRPVTYGPVRADEGLALCASILERETVNLALIVHVHHVTAALAAMRGDFERARESGRRALALIEEFGLVLQTGVYSMDVGLASLLSGDLDEAERELRRGYDVLAGMREKGGRTTVLGLLADAVFLQGRDEEAERLAEESRLTASADDLDAQPRWRAVLARVLARRGEQAAAERLVREAAALLEPCDFLPLQAYVLDVLGEVLRLGGKPGEAAAAVARALALHERKGNVVSAARSRAVLEALRAGS